MSGRLGWPTWLAHKDPPFQTFPEVGDILQSPVNIISQLTFFSSFFARTTLRMILPGGTRSSSAMISTDFTEGARLGSLEAGFDEVLDTTSMWRTQKSNFSFQLQEILTLTLAWRTQQKGSLRSPWILAILASSLSNEFSCANLERAARHCTDTWISPDLQPSSVNHFSTKPYIKLHYQSFPPYSRTWLWRMPIILMEALPRRSSLPTSSSNTFGWKFC